MSLFSQIKSPHIRKYLANTSWVFADFILRQGINIIIGIYLARYLKPEGYGQLGYSVVYLQILTPLALMGLNQVVIRELIKNSQDANKILGTSFFIKLAASIVTYLLIALIAFGFEHSEARTYILVASLSVFFTPFQVIDFFFQANVQSKYIVYSQQLSAIISSALRLYLIVYGYPLVYFIVLLVLESIITFGFFVLFFTLKGRHFKHWLFDKQTCRNFFKEILPIILASFFVAAYVRVDQIIIKYLLGDEELGIYLAAVKLSEPFYAIATLLVSSLFPAIVSGLKISPEEYRQRIQKLYNLLTFSAVAVCLGVSLFANFIIDITYGDSFIASRPVLIVYFWASVFVFQGVVASNSLVIEGKAKYSLIYTLMGALSNVSLNFLLIPAFGLIGAAWATLISYAMASVLFNSIFKETRHVFKQQMLSYLFITNIFQNLKELYRLKS